MLRNRFGLACAVAVLGLVVTAARAETFTCTTHCVFGPNDQLDNLTVKSGGTADLTGTHVKGNIVVETGGVLRLRHGVHVEGSVQSFGGYQIVVREAHVEGSVQIKNTWLITVRDSTIDGNVQLEENHGVLDKTKIVNNTIGADLQLYKNRFNNRQAKIINNDIFGNMQLVENRNGMIRVRGNYVESALQCSDNTSYIFGHNNDAGDLECSLLD